MLPKSKALRCVLGTWCVLLSASAVAQGLSTPGFPSNEQMRHYRGLGEMVLAPDAQHVVVRINDATADGGRVTFGCWILRVANRGS